MANYRADVWMGSSTGRQRVQVQSNTWNGAREMIKRVYGPGIKDTDIWNLEECDENGYGHYDHKPGDGSGAALLGAVAVGTVVAPFKIAGWGIKGVKNLAAKAEAEEQEAREAGGEKLAQWEKDQANMDKWVSRFGRYGGSYIGIGILGALGAEVIAGPLVIGWFGYVGYKVVTKTGQKLFGGKKDQNTYPQVEAQYRKEVL